MSELNVGTSTRIGNRIIEVENVNIARRRTHDALIVNHARTNARRLTLRTMIIQTKKLINLDIGASTNISNQSIRTFRAFAFAQFVSATGIKNIPKARRLRLKTVCG